MFLDPLSIIISGVTKTLARVRTGDLFSDYQDADGTVFQRISHQNANPPKGESGSHVKSLVGFRQRKVVADPLNAEQQEYKTLGLQISFDRPEYGFTKADLRALWSAAKAQMDDAFVDKLYGRES
jgi:hypothetical protein